MSENSLSVLAPCPRLYAFRSSFSDHRNLGRSTCLRRWCNQSPHAAVGRQRRRDPRICPNDDTTKCVCTHVHAFWPFVHRCNLPIWWLLVKMILFALGSTVSVMQFGSRIFTVGTALRGVDFSLIGHTGTHPYTSSSSP